MNAITLHNPDYTITEHPITVIEASEEKFTFLTIRWQVYKERIERRLTEKSFRQYALTFQHWNAFCEDHRLNPLDFTEHAVIAFLSNERWAYATRQARLTHIKVLVKELQKDNPTHTPYIEVLGLKNRDVKPKRVKEERVKKALKGVEVMNTFISSSGDDNLSVRNRALLAVLFYTGLRRSEAVALKWGDIDLKLGTIEVKHGKGDKARTVAILGDGVAYLEQWHEIHPVGWVFPQLSKTHRPLDRPISGERVRMITSALGFKPHDARRTLITNGLNAGSSIADLQRQAGHASPTTTLGYAKVSNALEVKARVKLGY